MDFVPRPATQQANKPLGKQKDQRDDHPERVFKFPRIEAFIDHVKEKGYINGDSLFLAFIGAYTFGLVHALTRDPSTMNELEDYERWIVENLVEPWTATFWFWNNMQIPAFFAVLYVALLWLGPKVMENYERPKWLKKYIIAWNVLLVVFSTIGSYKILSLITLDSYHGPRTFKENVYDVVCSDGSQQCQVRPSGCLWLMFFCGSKIPEMIDTVLLIVCKKKVIFLHWFHHLTVMLFCWLSFATRTPVGTVFAGMNYFVHSRMYCWYGLAAAGYKPTRYMSQMVTVLQIAQMVIVSILAFYTFFDSACSNHIYATTSGIMIYGSYLFLFVKFFISAYCRKRPRRSSKPKSKTS